MRDILIDSVLWLITWGLIFGACILTYILK